MWNVKCAGPAPVLRAATGPTGIDPRTEGSDAEGGPSVFQTRRSRFEAEVGGSVETARMHCERMNAVLSWITQALSTCTRIHLKYSPDRLP